MGHEQEGSSKGELSQKGWGIEGQLKGGKRQFYLSGPAVESHPTSDVFGRKGTKVKESFALPDEEKINVNPLHKRILKRLLLTTKENPVSTGDLIRFIYGNDIEITPEIRSRTWKIIELLNNKLKGKSWEIKIKTLPRKGRSPRVESQLYWQKLTKTEEATIPSKPPNPVLLTPGKRVKIPEIPIEAFVPLDEGGKIPDWLPRREIPPDSDPWEEPEVGIGITEIILSIMVLGSLRKISRNPMEILRSATSQSIYKKLVNADKTEEELRLHFMESFIEVLGRCWNLENSKSTREKQIIEFCQQLKEKGMTVEDIARQVREHFFPAPEELPSQPQSLLNPRG